MAIEATAHLVAGGTQVLHRSGNWRTQFPVDQLPRWLAFYRDLAARRSGRYAQFYRADVAALERVQAEIRAQAGLPAQPPC